ncbi:hypothetical protein AAG906_029768 [Vitis piasezkii]
MAKTRGAKTPSPSTRTRASRVSPVQDSMTEPSQPPVVPPSVEGAPPDMTSYDAQPGALAGPEHQEIPQPEHPEEPQPVEIPTDMRAPTLAIPSIGPMPEVASSAPPATPGTLPVVPAASEPHPSESSIAISISKFRGLCHTLQTLTATQSVLAQTAIRAHRDQLIAT